MGAKTGIEWTDATWNPIRGCSRVSEGCRHCYAETIATRFSGPGLAYEGLAVMQNWHPHWTGKIEFVEEHLLDPLKWGGVPVHREGCPWLNPPKDQHGFVDGETVIVKAPKLRRCKCPTRPRRIFVNSMSDLFHENVTDEMRDKIFAVMALCPQHIFQVLTKRPARMLEYLNTPERIQAISDGLYNHDVDKAGDHLICRGMDRILRPSSLGPVHTYEFPMPNVWPGVSVENQKAADDRLDYLCELADRGWQTMVSFEPLLSAVDPGEWWLSLGAKTWGIVGGESGPGARPMHPDWARSLRDQCVTAGVPFFFKQWGEYLPAMSDGPEIDGKTELNCSDEPVRVGKKKAGALLDGVEWKQFPEVRV